MRNILTANWQVKLMALVIAAVIWYYAGSRLKEEVILREVPVRIEIPEDYRLLHQSHRTVQVRLVGPQYLVQRRQEEDRQNYLQFRLRLTGEDLAGERLKLRVDASSLNVPASELAMMNVVAIEPEEIDIFASRMVKKTLPVQANISGQPPSGYELTEYTVIPSEVTVEGPSAVLARMPSIRTLSIPVWDMQESFRRYMLLNMTYNLSIDDRVEVPVPLSASPSQVAVHGTVDARHARVEMDNIPIKILQPMGFPYQAATPPEESAVRVVLSGPPAALERVRSTDIIVYLDVSELAEETVAPGTTSPYKQAVDVILGPDVDARVATVKPEEVTVLLTRSQ